MKKYLAEYGHIGPMIRPVEVQKESACFVWLPNGRKTALEGEHLWGRGRYCETFEEAKRYLMQMLSKKLEAVEAERRKLIEAMIEVSKMEE